MGKPQDDPENQWRGEFRLGNGDSARQIAVGRNADGRLEVFYVGTNYDLYHNWQTIPNGLLWARETRFPKDSAQQIVVGQNADGRLEIFYVGTNNDLYHNWQIAPTNWNQPTTVNNWAGETKFSKDSAQQIAVGQNADGRLEIFYVGTNNDLYHNWQLVPANWNQPTTVNDWAGETRFPNDSAQQIAVGQNADGRLEIFYVGTNSDLYHNWQTSSAPGFGSNSNQLLFNNCNPILGVSVTIDVTQDIVCAIATGSTNGFGFQLNAYSPMNEKSAWQQYVIALWGKEITGAVDNWPLQGANIINDIFNMVSLPTAKIPAGYQLTISLQNDSDNNINGATYVVVDDTGKTVANIVKTLNVGKSDLAPIIAFELNLVGPVNSEGAVLSSGAGTITYQATTALP